MSCFTLSGTSGSATATDDMARPRFKKPSPVFSAVELRRELEQSQRRELDAKIKRLRGEVKKAREAVRTEARKTRSDCLADLRLRLARLKNQIADARAKLRDLASEKRAAKPKTCSIEAGRVRAEKQAALDAKRKDLREEVSFREHERRRRKAARARGATEEREVRQETDQEVVDNLEAEDATLVPIFRKMRRSIRGTRDMSRTEAFLEWASKHQEEIAAERTASVPSDVEFAREMAAAYGQPYEEAPF